MDRKFYTLILGMVILLAFLSACGMLRTARIRKDVTINFYRDPNFDLLQNIRIAVIPTVPKEAGLSGIPYAANEAAAEIMSVKLWNEGFLIIDKIFIKEVLLKEKMAFSNYSVNEAVLLGGNLGADYVMLTSLTELKEDTRSVDFGPFNIVNTVDTSVLVGLNCRLVDVINRRTVWTGVATTQDKNLQLALRRISLRLIHSISVHSTKPQDRKIPIIGVHF